LPQSGKISRICALFIAYTGERAYKDIGDWLQRPCSLSRVDHERKIRSRKQRTYIRNIFLCKSGLECQEYGRRDPSRWPRGTFYPQKLALTLSTSVGLSVDIVWSLIQATEVFLFPF
jgi:hypothetical protein